MDRRAPLVRPLTPCRAGAALLAGLLLLGGCSLQHPLDQGSEDSIATVGKAAPDFSGTDLDGKSIKLADYRGAPLLINFWASWCGPCRAEQPGLTKLAADYQPQGVRLMGVDVRDNLEQARIFRDEFKVPYPSLFDQASRLGYAYQIDAPPGIVLVDRHGSVQYAAPGELTEDALRHLLEQKLLTG